VWRICASPTRPSCAPSGATACWAV
jgi:hypothetical protein